MDVLLLIWWLLWFRVSGIGCGGGGGGVGGGGGGAAAA